MRTDDLPHSSVPEEQLAADAALRREQTQRLLAEARELHLSIARTHLDFVRASERFEELVRDLRARTTARERERFSWRTSRRTTVP